MNAQQSEPARRSEPADGLAALAIADAALGALVAAVGGTASSRRPSPFEQARRDHVWSRVVRIVNATHLDIAVFGGAPGVSRAYDDDGGYLGGDEDGRWGSGITIPAGTTLFGTAPDDLLSVVSRLLKSSSSPQFRTGSDEKLLRGHVKRLEAARAQLGQRQRELEHTLIDVALVQVAEQAAVESAEEVANRTVPTSLTTFLT